MSLIPLLNAVRDQLHTVLQLDDRECDVREGPEPPANAGKLFIAIWGGSWQPYTAHNHDYFAEQFGVDVCISLRTGSIPTSRFGDVAMADARTGALIIGRAVAKAIHCQPNIIIRANNNLGISFPETRNGFCEPLRWLNSDAQPRRVGSDWWLSSDDKPFAGMALTIRFGEAVRIEEIIHTGT